MSSKGELHAISSYSPTRTRTRVHPNDGRRFLGNEATDHCSAGLSNTRPRSMAAHPRAVTRTEFDLRRLNVSGQRVLLSKEPNQLSRGDAKERRLRSVVYGAYDFDDALFDNPSPIERHSENVQATPSCVDPRDYTPKTDWWIRSEVIAPLDDVPHSCDKRADNLPQYSATGLPIAGSPVAANELALSRWNKIDGRALDDWNSWLTQVLKGTDSSHEARGTAEQALGRTQFTFEVWAPQ